MRIVDKGIVYAPGRNKDRQSCAFPGICILPSGRWLCGFRSAPTKTSVSGQKALVSWSDDSGKTWSIPADPFTPPAVEGKTGLFRAVQPTSLGGSEVLATIYWVDASDTSLDFFNTETQGLLDSRIFFSLSNDDGVTWSEPEMMDTTPFNIPTPITGPALVLANGELACQFETNKHYNDTSIWIHKSVLMFSRDNGHTWSEHSLASYVGEDRVFYWDQRPNVLADGRILDLFWTYDELNSIYRNIHARESFDSGRSWSDIWNTGVPGQPAQPVSLPDGRICMVYVDRTAAPTIKACVSSDFGRTWSLETEVIIYEPNLSSQTWDKGMMQDAWSEMEAYSIGLPSTSMTAEGDVVTAFYAGSDSDHTVIEWARLAIG